MCLAPCFAGCSKEEYDAEVQRFVKFLESSGESLRTTFEGERERASEDMDYERAAALHKKVEKLDEVLRGRPELVRCIQALDAVILQRGASEQVVAAYRVQAGKLCEPFFVCPFGAARLPANRVRRNTFSETIWIPRRPSRMRRRRWLSLSTVALSNRMLCRHPKTYRHRKANSVNICGWWRDGFTAIRERARFSFARKMIGPIAEFCEAYARVYWLRRSRRRLGAPAIGPTGCYTSR